MKNKKSINYDISELINGLLLKIDIDELIKFKSEDLKGTDIKKIDDVEVKGYISFERDIYYLYLNIKTNLYLEDSRTLEIIKFPIDIQVSHEIGENTEDENYYKISKNTLDILPIVWENIVLEVPLRVVKDDKDIVLEGNGWSLNKEENN